MLEHFLVNVRYQTDTTLKFFHFFSLGNNMDKYYLYLEEILFLFKDLLLYTLYLLLLLNEISENKFVLQIFFSFMNKMNCTIVIR